MPVFLRWTFGLFSSSDGMVFAVCNTRQTTHGISVPAKRLFAVCHDPRHTANKFLLNLNFTQLIRFKKLFYEIKLNDQSKNIAKYSKQLMFYDSNKFDLTKFNVFVSQSA